MAIGIGDSNWYEELLKNGPTETIALVGEISTELLETISAFANTKGGIILVGTTRADDIVGCEFRSVGALIDDIARHFLEPFPTITATDGNFRGISLPIIQVSQMRAVVRLLDGSIYRRRGGTNENVSDATKGTVTAQVGVSTTKTAEPLAEPAAPPPPRDRRQRACLPATMEGELPGIDLLLSGGGYRATLFHLGLLRFLYEYEDVVTHAPLLSKVSRIIGVSGGSITAAHVSVNRLGYLAKFSTEARKLIDFVKTKDMRRDLLVRGIGIADSLTDLLGIDNAFETLSQQVRLDLLGTDYHSGGTISFGNKGITHLNINSTTTYQSTQRIDRPKLTGVRIRQAVAASSAFPPVFPPVALAPRLFFGGCDVRALADLNGKLIGDGGIRDNLGIEYYFTTCDDARVCLISDAGYPFDWDTREYDDQSFPGWGRRLQRVTNIQMDRLQALDCGDLHGAYLLSISEADDGPPQPDDQRSLHDQPLSRASGRGVLNIQTDLIPVTSAEIFAAVRLAYDVAERRFGTASGFSSRFQKRANLPDADFWKELWPKDLTKSDSGANDPLAGALAGVRPRFTDLIDAAQHGRRSIPQWMLIAALAALLIIVLLSALGGGLVHSWFFALQSDCKDANTLPLRNQIDELSELSPAAKTQTVENVTIKAYLHEALGGRASEVVTLFFLGQSNTSNKNEQSAGPPLGSIKIQAIRLGAMSADSVVLHARTASSVPSSESANDYTETHVYRQRKASGKPEHVWSSVSGRACKIADVKVDDVLFVVAGYPDGIVETDPVYQDPLQIEVDDYGVGEPIRFLVGEGSAVRKPKLIRQWEVFPCVTGPRIKPLLDGSEVPVNWGRKSIGEIRGVLLPEVIASFATFWKSSDASLPQKWKKTFEYLNKSGGDLPGNWYFHQNDSQSRDTLHLIEWTP